MIDVRGGHELDVQAFARLRERCAFSGKPPEFLAALIAGARWIAHAYDPAADDRLVGFARAISMVGVRKIILRDRRRALAWN